MLQPYTASTYLIDSRVDQSFGEPQVRKNHPEDRRVRLVELTAKGRRLIEKAYAQHSSDMEKAMNALSRHERAELLHLLTRLAQADEESAVPSIRAVR